MKITKNVDHYLLENEKGSYHLSFEDFDKLGKSEAIKFAEIFKGITTEGGE